MLEDDNQILPEYMERGIEIIERMGVPICQINQKIEYLGGDKSYSDFGIFDGAMLRKSAPSMTAPFPAILQRTASISALPRAEKRFMMAMRIWISAVWRAGSRDMILSPKSFRQFIRASTRLRT